MIRIVHINMHRCATAQDLLAQFAAETKSDLVLISEQYRNKDLGHGTLAYQAPLPSEFGTASSLGFLPKAEGTALSGFRVQGQYLTPSEMMPDIRRRLDALVDAILGTEGRIQVERDFNPRALEWGMLHPDSRGKRTLKMAEEQNLQF